MNDDGSDPQDDLEQEGEEASTFEEHIVEILGDAVENGIPVGVSLDEDAMTALRSVSDAVHKHTAAMKEQTKVFSSILDLLRTKLP